MRLLRATLTIVSILLFQPISHADNAPIFIGLRYICDANTKGTFPPVPRSSLFSYHQVLNYQHPRDVNACDDGIARFTEEPCQNRQGRSFTMHKYEVVCRGGIMSTLDMTSHVPDMVRLARSGNSLIVLETPIYPASDRVIARYMLPAGYGMLQDPHTIAAEPQQLDGRIFNPQISVEGTPPGEPTPVRNILADTAPFAQAALGLLALLYAGLAFIGRYHNPSGFLNPSKAGFVVLLFAALAGIYVSAYNPEAAVRDIYGQAHQAVSDIAADRAKLASLITVRNGLVEPFTHDAYQSALRLMRTHYIPDTADLQSKTTVRILATLVPLGLFLLLFSPFGMAGWYHLFVRPPIEKTLKPALRSGGPIDTKAANKDLALDPAQLRNPPPAFQSLSNSQILNVYITETERQAAELAARAKSTEAALNRKQSLLDKFNVASRLMRAIQCREVNRRELEELQQKLRETEARLAAHEKVK